MKKATFQLENDHVQILKLIDIMEHITREDIPDSSHIELITDIIKKFADGVHHAKEEEILFPFMAERGFSMQKGPVAVMLHEHEQGRKFVKGISENLIKYNQGDLEALHDVYANMNGYAALLRSHISKENNVLFRMADNILSDEDDQDMIRKFEEADRISDCRHDSPDCISKIRQLAKEYGI